MMPKPARDPCIGDPIAQPFASGISTSRSNHGPSFCYNSVADRGPPPGTRYGRQRLDMRVDFDVKCESSEPFLVTCTIAFREPSDGDDELTERS